MAPVGVSRTKRSVSSGLVITNLLEAGVQLTGIFDGLYLQHGLDEGLPARIVRALRGGCWVVVEKNRLATAFAASCATHAGKTLMHSARFDWTMIGASSMNSNDL